MSDEGVRVYEKRSFCMIRSCDALRRLKSVPPSRSKKTHKGSIPDGIQGISFVRPSSPPAGQYCVGNVRSVRIESHSCALREAFLPPPPPPCIDLHHSGCPALCGGMVVLDELPLQDRIGVCELTLCFCASRGSPANRSTVSGM